MKDYAYKFTEKEFARGMLEFGSIRIGTLYDYWNPKYPEGVRDEREGKIFKYRVIECGSNDLPPPQWGTSFFQIPFGRGIRLIDCSGTSVGKDRIPDMYVYCVTFDDSDACFSAFGAHYDVCVKIYPLSEFTRVLASVFQSELQASPVFSGPCTYGIREITYDKGTLNTHPAMLKDSSFEYQAEFRIVGETQLKNIAPRIIHLNAYRHLFSIHKTA